MPQMIHFQDETIQLQWLTMFSEDIEDGQLLKGDISEVWLLRDACCLQRNSVRDKDTWIRYSVSTGKALAIGSGSTSW